MPRISKISIFKLPERNIISIRCRTSVDKIAKAIGESYQKLFKYLNEENEFLTDMPFVLYHNMDMQDLDIEIGIPVSKLFSEKDEIKSRIIPEGKVVSCMYLGAYNKMEPTYNEMFEFIKKNNIEAENIGYEYYYNDFETKEENYLTRVDIPIK